MEILKEDIKKWSVAYSKKQKQYFYFNATTKESLWSNEFNKKFQKLSIEFWPFYSVEEIIQKDEEDYKKFEEERSRSPEWKCPDKTCRKRNHSWRIKCFVCESRKPNPTGKEVQLPEITSNDNWTGINRKETNMGEVAGKLEILAKDGLPGNPHSSHVQGMNKQEPLLHLEPPTQHAKTCIENSKSSECQQWSMRKHGVMQVPLSERDEDRLAANTPTSVPHALSGQIPKVGKLLKRKFGGCSPVHDSKRPEDKIPNKYNGTFDLRMKLQSKDKAKSVSSSSSQSAMEWEDSSSDRLQTDSQVVKTCVAAHGEEENYSTVPNRTNSEHYKKLKKLYLVCDTSALLHENCLAKQFLEKGRCNGLPNVSIQVVMPCIVFRELDRLKDKKESDIAYRARETMRYIKLFNESNSKNLILQKGKRSKEAVYSLDLWNNDDLVLNCSLQTKEACKEEEELTILMTTDNNLAIKAATYQLKVHDWTSFSKWTIGVRRQSKKISPSKIQLQNNENPYSCNAQIGSTPFDEPMDIDYFTDGENCISTTDTVQGRLEAEGSNKDSEIDTAVSNPIPLEVKNSIISYIQNLKMEFQSMLRDVLEEAVEVEYKDLKHNALKIESNWTLLRYIREIFKRSNLILPNSNPREISNFRSVIQQLIPEIRNFNSDKEAFTVEDVKKMFDLCEKLPELLASHYSKHTKEFLKKLEELKEEWKEASQTFYGSSGQTNEY